MPPFQQLPLSHRPIVHSFPHAPKPIQKGNVSGCTTISSQDMTIIIIVIIILHQVFFSQHPSFLC